MLVDWDVTVTCPLAESYVTGSAREAGAAAEVAASRKEEKYANIGSQYLFAPIAVETLGPLNASAARTVNVLMLSHVLETGVYTVYECAFRHFIGVLSVEFRQYYTCNDVHNTVQRIFASYSPMVKCSQKSPVFRAKKIWQPALA